MGEILDPRKAAAVGFVASLMGTIIGVVMIPEAPSIRGEMALSALVLAAGILFVPAIRAISGSRDTLNAENFVAIGFVYWILLDLLQGVYDLYDVSDESIRSALIAVGISAACMWAGSFGRPWRLPQSFVDVVSRPLESAFVSKMISVCFVLGMSSFVYAVNFDLPEMFSYLGESRWDAPWARGQLGGWDAFLEHTQYFGYVLPSLAILLVVRRGWLRPESFLALAAAAIQVAFIGQSGGRRIIGVTIGAAILVWMLAQPGIKVRKMLGVVLGVSGLLWLMQFVLEIRSGGYEEYIQRGSSYKYLHVDDNFRRLAQVIDIIPAEHSYVYFQQIVFALVRPIPRVFWEGKPVDPGFDLTSALGMEGVSLTTSIIGEWYMSFGWVAIMIGGWLHGRLASAVNTLRDGKVVAGNPIVFSLAVLVLVVGVRSMLDLVVMSYAILAWFGVSWMFARRARQNARI